MHLSDASPFMHTHMCASDDERVRAISVRAAIRFGFSENIYEKIREFCAPLRVTPINGPFALIYQ